MDYFVLAFPCSKCNNLENTRPCQVWPNTSCQLALSNYIFVMSSPSYPDVQDALWHWWKTLNELGPFGIHDQRTQTDVQLHVCLIRSQTREKKKCLGLVKTSRSLGTPGFAPIAPLWPWKKVSLLHMFQSLPKFTASCFFIVEILVDIQGFLQNCQHIASPFVPAIPLYAIAGAIVVWRFAKMHISTIYSLRLMKACLRLMMMTIAGVTM